MNATRIETELNKTISDLMGIADLPHRSMTTYECGEIRMGALQAASDLRDLRDRVCEPEPDRQEGDADHIRHRKMIDAMRREERTRIRKMIDKTALSLLDSDLDHDVPSELNATDTILSVLEIVKAELTWGICTDAFRHLYPGSKPVTVPEPVDLSALKEHLDDYPVDPTVQEGLDQAARGEFVPDPRMTATEAAMSLEETFMPNKGFLHWFGISTPPSYIEMVRKHRQRAWEAARDALWSESDDDQYGIPYFIDTAAEPPEPDLDKLDTDGITLYLSHTDGLVRVEPAYFEPMLRQTIQDTWWMLPPVIQDLRTGKVYPMSIEYVDEPPVKALEWVIVGATVVVSPTIATLWSHTLEAFADRLGASMTSPRDKADAPTSCVLFDLTREDGAKAVVPVTFSMETLTNGSVSPKNCAEALRIEALKYVKNFKEQEDHAAQTRGTQI